MSKSGGMCPCKSVKVIAKLRAVPSSSIRKKCRIIYNYSTIHCKYFLISHSSEDIPLLVGHPQIPPTNYYTFMEAYLEKYLKLLPGM
jgi:hypothetical protein